MFKRAFIAFALLVTIGLVTIAALFYYYNSLLEPVESTASENYYIVEIPSGANAEIIAAILYDKSLIRNERAFRLFVRQYNLGRGFIAGKYNLSPAMSTQQIIAKIHSGDIYTETSWFTIPEGYTVVEIAARLEENGLVDSEHFLNLVRKPSESILETFPFLIEVTDTRIEYVLEGYLFPDTYEVYTDAGAEEIIKVMLHRLNQILDEDKKNRLTELDLSIHEMLTIASIVEREGRVNHERNLIAGVFYNRLQIGQRLESCATIQYILGETKEYLTFQDLEIPSPYNTYQNTGLPPGPIAAPGEASIMAVLYPETTTYFYFNYKYDGSGEHYFSKTLEEHNQNVRRAEANIQ